MKLPLFVNSISRHASNVDGSETVTIEDNHDKKVFEVVWYKDKENSRQVLFSAKDEQTCRNKLVSFVDKLNNDS